jgi:hypothetical protein
MKKVICLFFLTVLCFETINAQSISRDPEPRKDIANVFYKTQYTLFDMWSDEPIFSDTRGFYDIYYATNEDKTPKNFKGTGIDLSQMTVYKFKNYSNCKNWSDGVAYSKQNDLSNSINYNNTNQYITYQHCDGLVSTINSLNAKVTVYTIEEWTSKIMVPAIASYLSENFDIVGEDNINIAIEECKSCILSRFNISQSNQSNEIRLAEEKKREQQSIVDEKTNKSKKIDCPSCSECNGSGFIEKKIDLSELLGGAAINKDDLKSTCKLCKGTGCEEERPRNEEADKFARAFLEYTREIARKEDAKYYNSNNSSGSNNYSAPKNQSQDACSYCNGTGQCQSCNKFVDKRFLERCGINSRKEVKHGYTICNTCNGFGHKLASAYDCDCKNGIGSCPGETCYGCKGSGWYDCNACKYDKGKCMQCKGTGKKR